MSGKGLVSWLTQRFELSRGSHTENLRVMEGLRGLAVFLVFLVHFVTLVQPWIDAHEALTRFAKILHSAGNNGVDLFFVLSGYLIYGSLISRPQPFLRFMTRRIERIYPAFLVVFALYVMLSLLFPAENRIPTQALDGLSYLLANLLLLPGIFDIKPMITVAWSLSYEMFYYLSVPLVIAALDLHDRSPRWRAALFIGVASGTAIYCAIAGGHVRLIMFIAGMLLHETMRHTYRIAPSSTSGLLALSLALLGTQLPIGGTLGATLEACILFVAFYVLCLSTFCAPRAWLARGFSWTPLRWLGNMSYSYYLLHGLALKAAFLGLSRILPTDGQDEWLFWALLPPMFLWTLVPTAVLFLMIERPFSLAPVSRAQHMPSPKEHRSVNADQEQDAGLSER